MPHYIEDDGIRPADSLTCGELQALFDMQHRRVEAANHAWQEAHGKPDTIPDLGALVEWLMQDRDRLACAQPATCPVSLLWDTVTKQLAEIGHQPPTKGEEQ